MRDGADDVLFVGGSQRGHLDAFSEFYKDARNACQYVHESALKQLGGLELEDLQVATSTERR